MLTSATFDPVATTYDDEFTRTPIARLMRQAVWARMDTHFHMGMRVLELGCGTGEDALHLAQRGIHVTATDASENMLAVTQRKAESMGVWGLVETQQLDMNALDSSFIPHPSSFDGVLSNFGALNCVTNYPLLITHLHQWTKPHARLLFVVMGPFCPWEIVWHLAHLQPRQAFRRFARNGALAHVGENSVRAFYPSPAKLIKLCAPYFEPLRVSGLGVLLPPPYVQRSQYPVSSIQPDISHLTTDYWLLNTVNWLEHRVAHWFPFNQCGDHYILELERRA
jgi:ubiquinone/menaquinone biosynthesis C-methylase UbiE